MQRKYLTSLFILFFLGLSFTTQANQGGQSLEGSWSVTITATNPPLPNFVSLMTFMPNGGMLESRRLYVPGHLTPFGSLLETPGHGEWVRKAESEFESSFVFLLQGAPDNPSLAGQDIGTDNIRLHFRLEPSNEELKGTFTSGIIDKDGNVLFTATGTISGKRIRVNAY